MAGSVPLPGSERPRQRDAERISDLSPDEHVELTVTLAGPPLPEPAGAEPLTREAFAREHGADFTIDYKNEDIRERVKAICTQLGRKGVDVVYDPVGGACFEASLRCVDWGARLVVVGFAGGDVPQIPANILLVKNIDALGFFFGSYRQHRPAMVGAAFGELARMFEHGTLKPHVSHQIPMEEITEAFDLLANRRSTGKVVLTVPR